MSFEYLGIFGHVEFKNTYILTILAGEQVTTM
jgi:hypothetical protein